MEEYERVLFKTASGGGGLKTYKLVLGTFPKEFSQMATFQMCNFPIGHFPKVRLGPLRHHRLQWGPSAAARMG